MRRFLVVLALALSLPINASGATFPPISEWGPGGSINGATAPTYTLPITVLDGIRSTIPAGERRRAWTRIRNEALGEWGIPFLVQNAPGIEVPSTGTIALVRSQTPQTLQGAWIEDSLAGVVLLSVDKGWFQWQGLWRGFIAHEVGHALGFGHPYATEELDSPTFNCAFKYVMACGYHVSDEERAFAQAYYLG